MVKPTFLCIGVQKAGTMSLINYLNLNDEIFMNKNELHFFDNTIQTKENIANYEKNFNTNKLII